MCATILNISSGPFTMCAAIRSETFGLYSMCATIYCKAFAPYSMCTTIRSKLLDRTTCVGKVLGSVVKLSKFVLHQFFFHFEFF